MCPCERVFAQTQGHAELRALLVGQSDAVREIADALREAYPSIVILRDPAAFAKRPEGINLLIGAAAVDAVGTRELPGPSIALFTSRESLEATGFLSRGHTTAIYADPAPAAQFRLIRRLFHRAVRVGIIVGEHSERLRDLYREAATSADVEPVFEKASASGGVTAPLNRFRNVSALLAAPDSGVWTGNNLRVLLESSYRRNLPLIGYSSGMVSAGSLATCYSALDDVMAQLRELISSVLSGRTPPPQYPRYWRVTVNENVARSMGIPLEDDVRMLGSPRPAIRGGE